MIIASPLTSSQGHQVYCGTQVENHRGKWTREGYLGGIKVFKNAVLFSVTAEIWRSFIRVFEAKKSMGRNLQPVIRLGQQRKELKSISYYVELLQYWVLKIVIRLNPSIMYNATLMKTE